MNTNALPRAQFKPILAFLIGLALIWILAQAVLQSPAYILIPVMIAAAVIALVQIMKNWRTGILIFLVWMLFEDLARKFMGNNMALYFAKDLLAAACLLSFYRGNIRERRVDFRLAFFSPFVLFFAWAVLEVFNPYSPSPLYGLLGLNDYFGYVPLFFLGYALLRNGNDLRRFLLFNLAIAALIGALGIAQSISGQALLAPAELAPDIRELGTLQREVPTTHERFIRVTSVFVSDGRFSSYMLMAWILGFGAATYFFTRGLSGRGWILAAMVTLMGAILLSGSRGALLYSLISASVMAIAYLREIRWRTTRAHRIAVAVVSTVVLVGLAMIFLSAVYPEALGPRIAFYQETLLPSSPNSELGWRAWGYPLSEFAKAFDSPNWILGNGTGTCSLGTQYVTRIAGASPSGIGVESGFGNLMLELGLPGLALWAAWTIALLISCWSVMRRLRGTILFPVGFAISWFVFLMLFPDMLGGLSYENFVLNAFLCLLLGVFFSLPSLLETEQAPAVARSLLGIR